MSKHQIAIHGGPPVGVVCERSSSGSKLLAKFIEPGVTAVRGRLE